MEKDWLELARISKIFFSEEDPHKLLDSVMKQSLMVLGAERATVFMYGSDATGGGTKRQLQSVVAIGVQGDPIIVDISNSLAGYCFSSQQAYYSNDVQTDSRFNPAIDQKTGYTTKNVLCVPIGHNVGVLQILNSAKGKFDEEDLEKARLFAFFAATALDQASKLNSLKMLKEGLTKYQQDHVCMRGGELESSNEYLAELYNKLEHVSESDANILVEGLAGTGKKVLAEKIHCLSRRKDGPLISINCAMLTELAFELELLGHFPLAEQSSFRFHSKLQIADGGTLILNEVDELSPNSQALLLKILREYKVDRLQGSEQRAKVDFRLVTTSHKNLKQLVEDKKFREDLYYRLNVIQIQMPTLDERLDDIEALSQDILSRLKHRFSHYRAKQFDKDCFAYLKKLKWPGNIRQLQNRIESALIHSGPRNDLRSIDFGDSWNEDKLQKSNVVEFKKDDKQKDLNYLLELSSFKEAKKQFEFDFVEQALELCAGNKTKAAKMIGLSREALRKILLQRDERVFLFDEKKAA